MALRNLVDKDCGGNNPLVNLTQHFNPDKYDRRWSDIDQQNQHEEIGQLEGPNRFAMDSLLQTLGPDVNSQTEINMASSSNQLQYPPPQGLHQQQSTPNSHYWLDSFLATSSSSSPQVSQVNSQFKQERKSKPSKSVSMISPFNATQFNRWPMGGRPGSLRPRFPVMQQPPLNSYQRDQNAKPAHEYLEDFHRQLEVEKAREKDLESIRKKFDTSSLPEEARKFVESVRDDPEVQSTDFLNFIKKIGDGQLEVTEEGIISHEDTTLSEVWANEFSTAQQVWEDNAVQSDNEFWDTLSQDWVRENNQDSSPTAFPDIPTDFTADFGDTSTSGHEYKFNPNNPHQDAIDPFQEGLKRLEDGDIPSAVLYFEAACQKDPSQHLYWQYLGTSQAQNEHDSQAILALKTCIDLQPDNLIALMALAVSHTNQAEVKEACENLFLWIIRNPAYSELVPEAYKNSTLEVMTSEKLRRVRDMYLQAARLSPRPLDADIQCGLGVLLNLTGEYAKAADCFRAALSVRPNDSTLWNRLGATLANGDKSEEAVAAYEKALSISPGFIRSRFNLGIACINLGAHRQAAEHFLTVLNLQKLGQGADGQSSIKIMSGNVWSTLRLTLSLMNRHDLYKCIDQRDLDSLNREFNINPADFVKN